MKATIAGPARCSSTRDEDSQWAGMGRQLLADEPAFAEAIAELEPEFVAQAGFSLHRTLIDGRKVLSKASSNIQLVTDRTCSWRLTALWRSLRDRNPISVIGHSMGEVAAAVIAGALTPAEGLRVTATRARLMAPLSGQGAMALLELDADRHRGC